MRVELGRRQIFRPPAWYSSQLVRLGGWTPNKLPYFRLSWGWSRLALIGGVYMQDTGIVDPETGIEQVVPRVAPLRLAPKYADFEKWYLEMWRPPEAFGTPESWHYEQVEAVPAGCQDAPEGALVEQLGPYPDRGDYEPMFVFNALRGRPLPYFLLEESLWLVRNARHVTAKQRYAYKLAAAREDEERRRKEHDDEVKEWFGRIIRPYGEDTPSIAVPSSYNPATRKVSVN